MIILRRFPSPSLQPTLKQAVWILQSFIFSLMDLQRIHSLLGFSDYFSTCFLPGLGWGCTDRFEHLLYNNVGVSLRHIVQNVVHITIKWSRDEEIVNERAQRNLVVWSLFTVVLGVCFFPFNTTIKKLVIHERQFTFRSVFHFREVTIVVLIVMVVMVIPIDCDGGDGDIYWLWWWWWWWHIWNLCVGAAIQSTQNDFSWFLQKKLITLLWSTHFMVSFPRRTLVDTASIALNDVVFMPCWTLMVTSAAVVA